MSMKSALICLTVAAYVPREGLRDRELVEAIVTAYEANRAAITHGFARFRFLRGRGEDIDVVAKDGPNDYGEAQGLYAFDGPNARYESVFAPEDMITDRMPTEDGGFSTRFPSDRLLTDGELILADQLFPASIDPPRYTHQAQIAAGTDSFYNQMFFPLHINFPDSFPLYEPRLEELLEESGDLRLDGVEDVVLDGRPVIKLTLGATESRTEYWFDVERGAIPVRTIITELEGGAQWNTRYDDVRPVAGGRAWLPFRWAITFSGIAKQLIIDEADFDHRPDPNIFRLEFDPPIRLVNAADRVTYEPHSSYSLLDLPPRSEAQPFIYISKDSPAAPPPVMPGERDPRPWWVVPASGIMAITILAVLALSIRRWRRAY